LGRFGISYLLVNFYWVLPRIRRFGWLIYLKKRALGKERDSLPILNFRPPGLEKGEFGG